MGDGDSNSTLLNMLLREQVQRAIATLLTDILLLIKFIYLSKFIHKIYS